MRKYYLLVAGPLLVSVYVYVFYRTNHTVVNELLLFCLPDGTFLTAKAQVATALPLPGFVIFSLSGGLWAFSATLLSRNLSIKLGRLTIHCACLPLLYVLSLKGLQRMHLIKGRFDPLDFLTCALAWGVAARWIRCPYQAGEIGRHRSVRTPLLLTTYALIYLSHVGA